MKGGGNVAEEKWEEAVKEEELREGVPVAVKLEKKNVLLVKTGGTVHACGGKCTHYGVPLKDGVLLGHVLTCPGHNARFDVSTGKAEAPPALENLAHYETKVERGKVFIRKAGKGASSAREPSTKVSAKKKETYIIVGAGAAGNAAALTLRRNGYEGRLIMVTAESELPYDRPNLSKDFLTGEVKREWMSLGPPELYKNLQIEVWTGHKAINLDARNKTVSFAHESQIGFDKALLATGGIPRSPGIPGTESPGFFLLRSLSDAEAILKNLEGAGEAVVIGSSFIGLEVAASLRTRNVAVHVVSPDAVPLARVFGGKIGARIRGIHEKQGVVFQLGVSVDEIAANGKRKIVKLSNGKSIPADIVIAGIGVVPAVTYLLDSGLVESGAVPVKGTLETKAEGIFAAGDIAIVPDPLSGKTRRIEHWVEAERQGRHAALAMLGAKEPYAEVPFFWTKQYDTALKYVGHAKSFDRVVYRGKVEEDDFIAGYYEKEKIQAAAGCGRSTDIILIGELLKAGKGPSAAQLEDGGVALHDLLRMKPD